MIVRRILIRTLLTRRSKNFGGVLQAFALQMFLRDEGFDANTDISLRFTVKELVKVCIRFLAKLGLLGKKGLVRHADFPNPSIERFIAKNLNCETLFPFPQRKLKRYDTFIVGSDQIWRPKYTNTLDGFLKFVPSGSAKKLAYSGSFGLDTLEEFDENEIHQIGNLLEDFDAISVRENSAVSLFEDTWGVKPIKTSDPIFLLEPRNYRDLYMKNRGQINLPKPYIASYLLDGTAVSADLIRDLNQWNNLSHVVLFCDSGQRNRADRMAPSIEDWLMVIDNAALLVTDSFHGAAFAILFNKPFIVLKNEKRGNARIESLLKEFGISEESVDPENLKRDQEIPKIDWNTVNKLISKNRDHSKGFLRSSLAGSIEKRRA